MASYKLPKLTFNDAKLQSLYDSIASSGPATVRNTSPISNLTDLSSYDPTVIPRLTQAAQQAGANNDPAGLAHINQQIKMYGGKPYEPSHHQGIFHRFLDIIQRPEYSIMSGLAGTQENKYKHKGGFWNTGTLKSFVQGLGTGIEGKTKTTGSQFLQTKADVDKAIRDKNFTGPLDAKYGQAHINPVAKGVFGAGADIAWDPLTYTGAGTVTKAGKGTEEAIAASRAATEAASQGTDLTKAEKELLSGSTAVGKSSAGKSKIFSNIQPFLNHIGDHAAMNVDENAIKMSMLGQKSSVVNDAIKAAKDQESIAAMKPVIDNYLKVAGSPVDRQLALRFMNSKVALPGSDKMLKALAAPTKIDPVAKGLDVFRKHMQVSYKIAPEIHSAGSGVFGYEVGRMRAYGQLLDQNFKGLKRADRETILNDVLAGATGEGDHALAGPTKFVANQLEQLRHAIEGTFGAEGTLSHTELNKWMFGRDQFKAGTKANPEWFVPSIKNFGEKDAGKLLWKLHSAYTRALTYKSFKNSMAESLGVPLTEDLKSTTNHLASKGWKSSKMIGDTHIFDPEVADGIDKMLSHIANHGQIGAFGRTIRAMTQPIKTSLTKWSPGYHARNAFTDAFINAIHGVSIRNYKKAGAIMHARGHAWEHGDNPLFLQEGDPLGNALQVGENVGPGGIQNRFKLKGADGVTRPQITSSELYAGAHKYGVFQTFSANEFPTHLADKSGFSKGLQAVSNKVSKLSDDRESVMRLSHFIQRVADNPTKAKTLDEAMAHAAQEVRKWHVDYSDFTKFERNVMSNVFPFYKWTRKNIPLMVEALFTHPGQVVAVPKLERMLSEMAGYDTQNSMFPGGLDKIVPQWMKDAGYVPIAKADGNGGFYVALPNPFTDLVNQTLAPVGESPGGWKQTLGASLNPLAKIPLEEFSGKQFFGNQKITDQTKYFLGQLPATKVGYNVKQGNFGSLASFLSGIYTQQNTPKRQAGEINSEQYQAKQRLTQARTSYRKKHHIPKGARMTGR